MLVNKIPNGAHENKSSFISDAQDLLSHTEEKGLKAYCI